MSNADHRPRLVGLDDESDGDDDAPARLPRRPRPRRSRSSPTRLPQGGVALRTSTPVSDVRPIARPKTAAIHRQGQECSAPSGFTTQSNACIASKALRLRLPAPQRADRQAFAPRVQTSAHRRVRLHGRDNVRRYLAHLAALNQRTDEVLFGHGTPRQAADAVLPRPSARRPRLGSKSRFGRWCLRRTLLRFNSARPRIVASTRSGRVGRGRVSSTGC